MDAVDETIPEPKRALDKPFSLSVEDVFSIQGRGTVVTGRIEQGIVRTGDEVQIVGINPGVVKSTVTGAQARSLPLVPASQNSAVTDGQSPSRNMSSRR